MTIEALARSFYRDSRRYGFNQLDYVRFVNLLLDITIQNSGNSDKRGNPAERTRPHRQMDRDDLNLPLQGVHVRIRGFESNDIFLFDRWLSGIHCRQILLSRATSRESDIREVVQSPCNIVGIVTLNDFTPVGAIAYLEYDPVQREAGLRKLIGEANWRRKSDVPLGIEGHLELD